MRLCCGCHHCNASPHSVYILRCGPHRRRCLSSLYGSSEEEWWTPDVALPEPRAFSEILGRLRQTILCTRDGLVVAADGDEIQDNAGEVGSWSLTVHPCCDGDLTMLSQRNPCLARPRRWTPASILRTHSSATCCEDHTAYPGTGSAVSIESCTTSHRSQCIPIAPHPDGYRQRPQYIYEMGFPQSDVLPLFLPLHRIH